MSPSSQPSPTRRNFLRCSVQALAGLATAAGQDPPNTHNMLVFGERTIFLSHLPMFDSVNPKTGGFTSPHRFQVILEAGFSQAGSDAEGVYRTDRQNNPAVRMYTLNPIEFVLSDVFSPAAGKPAMRSFNAKRVVRGHLERQGRRDILKGVQVTVKNVVHAREFSAKAAKPKQLEYLLFGKGPELFLAHLITRPPDFDQILAVQLAGHTLTDAELGRALRVVIPAKQNSAMERIREKQRVAGELRTGAKTVQVELTGMREVYFEEGELRIPAVFEQTPEEKAAGFTEEFQ